MVTQKHFSDIQDTVLIVLITLLPIAALFGNAPADISLSFTTICFIATTRSEWKKFTKSRFLQISILFWLWLLICSGISQFPSHSFQDSLPWVRLPLYAFALSHVLGRQNSRYLSYFVGAAVLGTLIELSFMFYEYSFVRGELARLHGTFGKLIAGWYLSCFGLITIFWCFEKLKLGINSIAIWSLILFYVALTSTGVLITGEIMTTLFFFGSLILYFLIRRSYSLRTLAVTTFSCAVLVGIALVLGLKDPLLQERIIHSISTRLPWMPSSDYNLPWTTGVTMAIENPLFGVGPKNFNLYCLSLKQAGTLEAVLHVTECQWHPHNLWLQVGSEAGVPGLILFSMLTIYLIHAAYHYSKTKLWDNNVPLILTLVLFFPIQTYSQAFGQSKTFYFWTLVGFSLLLIRQNLKDHGNDQRL